MRRRRGFSMVELLIGMVIIGAAMIPFLGMMIWGHQKTEMTVDQVAAENVALTYLEYIHSKDYGEITDSIEYPDDLAPLPSNLPMDFETSLSIEETFNLEFETPAAGGSGTVPDIVKVTCKLVTVTVTWKHRGNEKELILADVFLKPLSQIQ